MHTKIIMPRQQALRDVEQVVDLLHVQSGVAAALEFVDALETCFRGTAGRPAPRGHCRAFELGLPGLRMQPLGKHPFVVCFVEREDHIDIWRVLDTRTPSLAWVVAEEA